MTEIEQLREEIAKLRERVAVLEAAKHWTTPQQPFYTRPITIVSPPYHVGTPLPNPNEITCGLAAGQTIIHNASIPGATADPQTAQEWNKTSQFKG